MDFATGAPRQPTWSAELERAVLELRRRYPRWGKGKLVVLRGEGYSRRRSLIYKTQKVKKE